MKDIVIFDMSGVLFDTEHILYDSNVYAFHQQGLEFHHEDYIRFAGTSQARNLELTIELVGDESLGYRIYQDAHEYRLKTYKEKGAPKMPGLDDLLGRLAAEGIQMIVASSNDLTTVDRLLNKANIAGYFQGIVTGDQVEYAKPHPDIFLKALELANGEKNQAVCIEDSLNGVEAARRAGVDVIMVPDQIQPTAQAYEDCIAIVDRIDLALPHILNN